MRERILLLVTGRVSIALMNLLILISGLNSLREMFPLLSNAVNDIATLENITEGYATILIAYGVATEERGTLMEFLKLYPANRNTVQKAVDHICHHYGLSLLLLGLFVELCEEIVKLPNSIINTNGIESLMFGIAALLTIISTWTLLRFIWLLAFPRFYITEPDG